MASDKATPLGGARGVSGLALDRILPNSQDAEMAVLGAILLSPVEVGAQVRERLDESHFYYATHQVIFREIAGLQDSMAAVDAVTLSQRLQNKGLLDEIGGPAFLADLYNHVPTTANVEHYIDIVWEKHLLRKLINAAHDIISRSFNEQDEVKTWIDEVEQQIFSINSEKSASGAKPTRVLVHEAMTSIEKMFENRGTITGLSTGFRDLDKLTTGLHPGSMFVIAARPSMGKTALAMNIAESVAIDQGRPVGVFSLEMSSEELVKRMLCSRGAVNLRALSDGYPKEQDHSRLTTAASELVKAPMYIDDTPGLAINQLRARARRMHSQFHIELIVIDYMQLMRAPSRRAESSRQVEVADISAGVKALAKELKIPVIVLSQLNRQPEARDEGKPRLSDLRESGSIEQDADIVGLLVRPEVYEDDLEARDQLKGKATLVIAKQRNGPTGDVPLTFRHEFTRFEDAARITDEDLPGGGRE
ncbi:MAG: Replicative DNA helicase [Verrucomicrobiae bacterium]|nr:Replicative DNA helicase [Verrucomicrobiae bacterium]